MLGLEFKCMFLHFHLHIYITRSLCHYKEYSVKFSINITNVCQTSYTIHEIKEH